jgi:hypothetical protein
LQAYRALPESASPWYLQGGMEHRNVARGEKSEVFKRNDDLWKRLFLPKKRAHVPQEAAQGKLGEGVDHGVKQARRALEDGRAVVAASIRARDEGFNGRVGARCDGVWWHPVRNSRPADSSKHEPNGAVGDRGAG